MWRLEGNFTDGIKVAGVEADGRITVSYTSDDPARPSYVDSYDVLTRDSGLWPVGEDGPNPDGLKGTERGYSGSAGSTYSIPSVR